MIKFPSLKKLKAILIDFDGTLADSMSLLYECYCEFLKNLGYEGSREEFNTFIGPSLLEIVQILKQKYHLKESLEELYNQYFYLIKLKYHTILNIFPGAIEFIKMAKRNGYQLAIVSSSTKSEIEKFLVKHDLLTEFNLIVSCDDV